MAITLNKEYRFISKEYSNMALNVYGTSSVSNGRNVCLYDKDADPDDEMQRWKYQYDSGYGNRLHCMKDTDYVLDRSSGMTNSCANNAHTYKGTSTSAAESAITFIPVSGETNVYRIRLANRINNEFLFLTAANNNGTLPASAITSSTLTTANKNVYWATEATSGAAYRKQCWEAKEYISGGFSSGGGDNGQYLALPMDSCTVTVMYQDDSNPAYKHEWEAGGHFGLDMVGTPNTPYASGNGTVVGVGGSEKSGVGYWVAIRYDNVYAWNNENENISIIPSIIMRYYHLSARSTLNVGDAVSFGTTIGTYGHTGVWYDKMKSHLHLEVDTDTAHPLYTPTLTGNAGGLYAGVRGSGDTTFDPCTIFFVKNGTKKQVLSYSQSYCDIHPNAKESYINVAKIEKLQGHTQS